MSQTFYFPENSVHVVVVDPGVGTSRRPIAAQIGPQHFVCPDNGLLSAVIERAEREQWPVRIVQLNKPEYWLPKISDIFHGRDIFSPGQDPALLTLAEISQKVGTVLQDPEKQIVASYVANEVAFGLENLAVPRLEMRQRINTILDHLEIDQLYSRLDYALIGFSVILLVASTAFNLLGYDIFWVPPFLLDIASAKAA